MKILTVFFLLLVFSKPPFEELNDYGKWLEFHNLPSDSFKKVGTDLERKTLWYPFGLSENVLKQFEQFRKYSEDKSYFIDLDSYSTPLEEKDGKLICRGTGVDINVQVIRMSDFKATSLLFCGPIVFLKLQIGFRIRKCKF